MQVHLQNLHVKFVSSRVIGLRSKSQEQKAWYLIPPPLLWRTWRSLAANAVTASPFQSFRVWGYVHAATRGTTNSRVQTSNFRSADRPC